MRLLTAVSGVRVPQQAPKQTTQQSGFFVIIDVIGPLWLCHYALHTTLLLAVDAHKFANTRWPSAQQAPKQTTQTSGFFVVFVGLDTHTFGVRLCR